LSRLRRGFDSCSMAAGELVREIVPSSCLSKPYSAPLWPGIKLCQLKRPDIRMQSYHVRHQQLACKKEESIYGHSHRLKKSNYVNNQDFSSG
jgi:hypothetical protein